MASVAERSLDSISSRGVRDRMLAVCTVVTIIGGTSPVILLSESLRRVLVEVVGPMLFVTTWLMGRNLHFAV